MRPSRFHPNHVTHRLSAVSVAFVTAGMLAGLAPMTVSAGEATAARSLAVRESISATLRSHRGTRILNEQGHGSGTIPCSIVISLTINYTQATITFTCSASNGAISGRGVTAYYASGHVARFSGAVSVTRGSGSYSHAGGSLHIDGKLRRGSYALAAKVEGSVRL